ncbi:MAG: hypothetical protein R3315_04135, partial [Woeseiaceae bacterium]|nr:hypothetical protein [Woeseiaceae bacterium]
SQDYALGASVLGLMQDFVFEETGLAERLATFAPTHPKFVCFPGDDEPALIYRDPAQLDRELADQWGERGDTAAFRADEARVVEYLQAGYREARPPGLAEARARLGDTLTDLWIAGSARNLLDHYFTAERSKLYMAMTVTESGPVSLDEPWSAFTIPLMDSGSVFDGYYGFVKGGIWRITEELGRLNAELGVETRVGRSVTGIDRDRGKAVCDEAGRQIELPFDYLVMATDPLTAARLLGTAEEIRRTESLRFRGSSGKLNLMFGNPVRWKHGTDATDSEAAFRFFFGVSSVDAFEQATLRVLDDDVAYEPGYLQVYCEGAAMRRLGHDEPFDRLAVFFKNLSLGEKGEALPDVERQVKAALFEHIDNPGDCVWTRLLTPRDLQHLFHFPGGNLDHTMLVGGQTFSERHFSGDPETDFYRFGDLDNVYLCASGTYPCGSVTGTPGYMCSRQMLKRIAR